MKITTDIRYDFLIHTGLIKHVEVVIERKRNATVNCPLYNINLLR
ncbi:hypothetical protein PGH12_07240 [Chryseobacterium wangxinyae]|nr:hypothetical protein [Chryseobacterium sp. CY350]MCY0976945.1 hypothetical protein [Chryseobacterium sp. CY350]WBZ96945.1 hypothetical protein PGH12_07240 [Chryseobacterium sp. CY350]